jgi:pyruvate formate lyase activating enzyme
MDPIEHNKNCGMPNDIILENLRRLVDMNKDIVIRVPLIPGYTDSEKNISSIGKFVFSHGRGRIQGIELLPYHKGGVILYEMLGRSYPLDDMLHRQSDEYLQRLLDILTGVLKGSAAVSIAHAQ